MQDNGTENEPAAFGRRTFIKGAGATAGLAAAGVGSQRLDAAPIGTASAVLPLVPIGIAAGGAALGYLAHAAADYVLGDDRDYSGYTGANALHQEIVVGATEMSLADEQVLTNISNNVTYADNILLPKGKAAAAEAANNGESEAAQTDAMQNAIDDTTAVFQENLLKHWNAQHSQIIHHLNRVDEHADIATSDVYRWDDPGDLSYNVVGVEGVISTETTLQNGETATYKSSAVHQNKNSSTWTVAPDFIGNGEIEAAYSGTNSFNNGDPPAQYFVKGYDGGEEVGHHLTADFTSLWNDLIAARDRVNSNLSTFISDLNDAYPDGDIPMEDYVDPFTAYTEMSTDYDSTGYHGYAAASAAVLGIPTTAGKTMFITLEDSQVEVEAVLYTKHEPLDADDNPTTFKKGTTYDPTTWSEPAYIAYNGVFEDPETGEVTEENDFVKLDQPFTINSMVDKDGTELNETSLESKNTQTADVASLEEELAQIRQIQLDMQAEAQESTASGGFDFSSLAWGGFSGEMVALGGSIAAVLGAAFLGNR